MVWHPGVEDILMAHEYAGFVSKVRTSGFHLKQDRGLEILEEVINEAKKQENVFDCAAVYLKRLIEKHPFADGNHRTATIVTMQFLRKNNELFVPRKKLDMEEIVKVLKNEIKFISLEEVSHWIQTGELK